MHTSPLYKDNYYTKIIVVRPSVAEGQRKQFDLEPSYAISLATER